MHAGTLTLAKTRKPKEIVTLEAALERVQVGEDPGVQSSREYGQIDVIDPYDPDPRSGKLQTKVTSLKNDPVGLMFKLGQLGRGHDADEASARLKAARQYQNLWEMSEIAGARAIDTTREAVDGGRFQMPDTDRRLRGQRDLAEIDGHIGQKSVGLLRLVLVHKLPIANITIDEQARRATVREFRDVLSRVALFRGITGKAPSGRSPRDDHAALAQYADHPELHRAVHRAKQRDRKRG